MVSDDSSPEPLATALGGPGEFPWSIPANESQILIKCAAKRGASVVKNNGPSVVKANIGGVRIFMGSSASITVPKDKSLSVSDVQKNDNAGASGTYTCP